MSAEDRVSRLERLVRLMDSGALTRAEFEVAKAALLREDGQSTSRGGGGPYEAASAWAPDPRWQALVPGQQAAPSPDEVRPPARYWTFGRIVLATVGVSGIALLSMYAASSSQNGASSGATSGVLALVRPAAPHFVATTGRVDDSCSRLGEYCIQVECRVDNQGDGGGEARVEFRLMVEEAVVATHLEGVLVPPFDTRTAVHAFKEARLNKKHSALCTVR
jgi:hypothetical protein